jgi:hypothetical protein
VVASCYGDLCVLGQAFDLIKLAARNVALYLSIWQGMLAAGIVALRRRSSPGSCLTCSIEVVAKCICGFWKRR